MGLSPDVLFRAICTDLAVDPSVQSKYMDRPDMTLDRFRKHHLAYNVVRKWTPKDATDADALALESFTKANNRCKSWKVPVADDWADEIVFGEIRKQLDDFFHPSGSLLLSSLYDLNTIARPGPGVSVGAIGTSYYEKFFGSSLSSTSEYLYEMYRHYARRVPTLSDAECQRYESYGRPSIVSGSRCSFVPKTDSTSRMICVEPLLNMYYQLGFARLLEARLKSFFTIDLAEQPKINHGMSRAGSLDGSFATIDLRSASDSISLGLCEWLLPDWVFKTLVQLRSRTTEINHESVPLWMMSTMGNGFTFPLQTIIFSAILRACTTVFYIGPRTRNWSCFGDDLICRGEIYNRVVHILNKFGFEVNPQKSFFEGPFRESCGADWFLGQPVRPVYIRKLDGPHDIVTALNQLNLWCAQSGAVLDCSIQYLLSELPTRFRNLVPFTANIDSGLRVPLALAFPKHDRNGSFRFYTWERRPSRLWVGEGRIHSPSSSKKIPYNPAGLYASFLYGELNSSKESSEVAGYIMVRHDRKKYQRKPRCSPNWDYIPTGERANGAFLLWQQWETAVLCNFSYQNEVTLCG